MHVSDLQQDAGLSRYEVCVKYDRAGHGQRTELLVAEERLLEVRLNGTLAMKLACSPGNLPELVLGRLYSEGMISGIEDVEEIHIDEQGARAEVNLRRGALKKAHDLVPVTPIPWQYGWITSMAEAFMQNTPAYSATRGTHSCFLSVAGETLYSAEDLGRHNAMDKVVGCALRDGVDLRQAILYSSGRVPMDMAVKVIRSGIPVLASKAVPTAQAIQTARAYRLTLISPAQPAQLCVYSPAELP